jgi:hypothetical protein
MRQGGRQAAWEACAAPKRPSRGWAADPGVRPTGVLYRGSRRTERSEGNVYASDGAVLSGKLSVQEAHARANTQAAEQIRRNGAGNCHVSPEDYDPVLKSHLRRN